MTNNSVLQPGAPAPDFLLRDTHKNVVQLSDLRGKNVVLLFFPAAFTSVCTEELCYFRDNYAAYNDLNAVVFGISVDMPYTLAEFKKQQNLNFELLSDFNKEASIAYGSIYDTFATWMKGVSKRGSFVIDRAGTIAYAEVLDNSNAQVNFEAIKDTVERLNA